MDQPKLTNGCLVKDVHVEAYKLFSGGAYRILLANLGDSRALLYRARGASGRQQSRLQSRANTTLREVRLRCPTIKLPSHRCCWKAIFVGSSTPETHNVNLFWRHTLRIMEFFAVLPVITLDISIKVG